MPVTNSVVSTPADEPEIVISRTVAAPRELVFRCCIDPIHLVHFWGPHGSRMLVCELDPRPGGVWHQVLQFKDGESFPVTYVFVEIVPPERIVFRDAPHGTNYGDPLPSPQMLSTILLEPDGEGTRVTATIRFPDIAARDATHASGFTAVVVEANARMDAYIATIASG
jgi:uncharacterized protein YndB with AHSA1/START domain